MRGLAARGPGVLPLELLWGARLPSPDSLPSNRVMSAHGQRKAVSSCVFQLVGKWEKGIPRQTVFLHLKINNFILGQFMFSAKLSREYRLFHVPCPLLCTEFSTVYILHRSRAWVRVSLGTYTGTSLSSKSTAHVPVYCCCCTFYRFGQMCNGMSSLL